jgi:G3E family GTPase
MSPRAASKLLKRVEGTVPQEYIDKFAKRISVFGNARVVSEFNLGLKKAFEERDTNKTAAVNSETQKHFRAVETLNTNIFKTSSISKIAEEVLAKEAISSHHGPHHDDQEEMIKWHKDRQDKAKFNKWWSMPSNQKDEGTLEVKEQYESNPKNKRLTFKEWFFKYVWQDYTHWM